MKGILPAPLEGAASADSATNPQGKKDILASY